MQKRLGEVLQLGKREKNGTFLFLVSNIKAFYKYQRVQRFPFPSAENFLLSVKKEFPTYGKEPRKIKPETSQCRWQHIEPSETCITQDPRRTGSATRIKAPSGDTGCLRGGSSLVF